MSKERKDISSKNQKINRIVDKPYYSISEFANLFGVSTQALRFYHREKILIPDIIKENGYRYYSYNQIYELSTIVYLRKSNFSIEESRDYLTSRTYHKNVDSLKNTIFRMHRQIQDLQQLITTLQTRVNFVENWEKIINLEEEKIESLPSHHFIILGRGETDYMFQGIFSIPTFVIYDENEEHSYHLLLGGLLDEMPEKEWPAQAIVNTTPAGSYLIAYHKGSYTGCYDRICNLRKKYQQYHFSKTTYCINIIDPFIVQDSSQFITRLELPISE